MREIKGATPSSMQSGAMLQRIFAAVLLLGGCATHLPSPAAWGDAGAGRYIVGRRCVGCHSAQPDGDSIYRPAPPFRTLGERHDGFSVQQKMAAMSGTAHYGMPPTVLTPQEAWDVAAYINTFAAARPRAQRKMAVAPCIGVAC